MIETIKNYLQEWNITTTERQKLQHTYLVLVVAIVIIAGVISLFNAQNGRDLVRFAGAAIVIFIVNGLVWNLLSSFVLSKISSRPKRK